MKNKIIVENTQSKGVYNVSNIDGRLIKRAVRKSLAVKIAQEYVKKGRNRVAQITQNSFVIYNK